MPSLKSFKAKQIKDKINCDVRDDALTRLLFATDASIYQVEPAAVAFPRGVEETVSIIEAAASESLPVTARGAGTGLAGGAVGDGIIIDFSRHNRAITDLNVDARTVRVEAGVVLDQLNAFLSPHGLRFGPDVATSSRATLGGMINNNSSGSHVPKFGTTIESVRSLDLILANGTKATVGKGLNGLNDIEKDIGSLILRNADFVNEHMPPGLLKRWAGYGLDRWQRNSQDLTRIIGGSEGTLAIVTSAELDLQPIPTSPGLGVIFFASISEAMQATVELLELEPAAIEHIDRVLFDQTRGQIQFKKARALLDLDDQPCESLLLVEFFDDIHDKLNALKEKNIGLRTSIFLDAADQTPIWGLRKAGLSLLTGCKGSAKPTSGIEDVAILPEKLPDYVEGLQSLMKPLGLKGSFYGHAASGLLHVRPVVDMHLKEDVAKYRSLAEGASALTKQFKGSIAGEHGVGMARTEFLPEHLGPELMGVMTEIKQLFDPENLLNPGKIVRLPGTYEKPFKIDEQIRQGEGSSMKMPFEPVLKFAQKDHSFIGNLEQCNGCGGCRKPIPTMCPTYLATGEEIMTTRGRANTIRAALEHSHNGSIKSIFTPELDHALSACLACKACTTECPSNVNMALLKTELLHARHKAEGIPLRDRVIGRVDTIGKLASKLPGLTNAALKNPLVKQFNEKFLGISARRPLPSYAEKPFDASALENQKVAEPSRGKVYLWDDCFVKYNEPNIGEATLKVLNALGYKALLLEKQSCCGRPAFSTGQLDLAKDHAKKNIAAVKNAEPDIPILFLEPSCYSMFKQDYRELGIDGMDDIEPRCHLAEDFLFDLLGELDTAPVWKFDLPPFAVHTHCHTKSMSTRRTARDLLQQIPGVQVQELNTGCCGMAGAFGATKEKYDLSVQVAQPLIEQINALDDDTIVVASGTSCRHQIEHLADHHPKHILEVLADALP